MKETQMSLSAQKHGTLLKKQTQSKYKKLQPVADGWLKSMMSSTSVFNQPFPSEDLTAGFGIYSMFVSEIMFSVFMRTTTLGFLYSTVLFINTCIYFQSCIFALNNA